MNKIPGFNIRNSNIRIEKLLFLSILPEVYYVLNLIDIKWIIFIIFADCSLRLAEEDG